MSKELHAILQKYGLKFTMSITYENFDDTTYVSNGEFIMYFQGKKCGEMKFTYMGYMLIESMDFARCKKYNVPPPLSLGTIALYLSLAEIKQKECVCEVIKLNSCPYYKTTRRGTEFCLHCFYTKMGFEPDGDISQSWKELAQKCKLYNPKDEILCILCQCQKEKLIHLDTDHVNMEMIASFDHVYKNVRTQIRAMLE